MVQERRKYLSALALGVVCAVMLPAWSLLPPQPASAARPVLTPTPSPTPNGCDLAWRAVSSPDFGPNLYMSSVDAISANDVWAVGHYTNGSTPTIVTMHWNGSAWTAVPNPNPGFNYFNAIYSVSGSTSNDVWAVGFYRANSPNSLIMHWNGSTWGYQSGPYPGTIPMLYGVWAIAPNNVWAVGQQGSSAPYTSFINHYDGLSWSIVSSPNVGTLNAVGGSGPSDVWAVGANGILHWDGMAWTETSVPVGGPWNAVDSTGPSDAWATGPNGVVQWDGMAWTATSAIGGSSLDAIAPNDVWMMGTSIYHWDGTVWNTVPAPYPDLSALSAVSATDIWAVGASGTTSLSEHYSPVCGTVTSTPTPGSTFTATYTPAPPTATYTATPTASPSGPTNTPHPGTSTVIVPTATATNTPGGGTPTSTPSATATVCALTFTDVQPTDYFYASVRDLTCRGAISGYADNTFRPYNDTTRGQLAKIVVIAEGFPVDTSGGPHFTDVTASNPFYVFVETSYNRRLISGYSDGTFRWANNVTRGQLSKIVVAAEGWPVNTTGGPHFTDVPTTDPFYAFIETAYNRGIISGYSDGTFRPNNNATRGQISKIVDTAINQP